MSDPEDLIERIGTAAERSIAARAALSDAAETRNALIVEASLAGIDRGMIARAAKITTAGVQKVLERMEDKHGLGRMGLRPRGTARK